MYIYIFDLDDTLLHKPYKNYSDIYYDSKLDNLLTRLNGTKYIFTNATTTHAVKSLRRLGILHHFTDIYSRNKVKMKPHINGYKIINNQLMIDLIALDYNIFSENQIVFFDDRPENLQTAKLVDWKTVYVGKPRESLPFVDVVSHQNIYNAINYFI